MASALSTTISCFIIGLLFIVPGIVKTVYINQRITKDMLKTFKNFSDVFPLTPLGLRPPQKLYMETVGVCEIVLGTMLAFGSPASRKTALILFMIFMSGAVYSYAMLRDFQGCLVPCGYLGLLMWLFVCHVRHSVEDQKPKAD